jgi:hypothetical protein
MLEMTRGALLEIHLLEKNLEGLVFEKYPLEIINI